MFQCVQQVLCHTILKGPITYIVHSSQGPQVTLIRASLQELSS